MIGDEAHCKSPNSCNFLVQHAMGNFPDRAFMSDCLPGLPAENK